MVERKSSGPTAATITRIVSGAKKGGMEQLKVEIDGDKIIVTEIAAPAEPQNELDKWRAKRAAANNGH